MSRRPATVAAALLGLALLAGPAGAQVYTWVDADGSVHYSSEPPPPEQRRGKKVRTIDVDPEATLPTPAPPREVAGRADGQPAPPPAAAQAQPRPAPRPSVVIYTSSWCPWCKKAKAYFAGRGIPFTERDIERDIGPEERRLGLDRDKRVPVVLIGGRMVRGYAPDQYLAALEQPAR